MIGRIVFMLKLGRSFLAIALMFATTGVTVTNVTCAKAKEGTTCPLCIKHGMLKSCCVVTVNHLSVKSEFGKPAPASSHSQTLFIAPFEVPAPLQTVSRAGSYTVSRIAPPITSVEECVLLSQFRI